MDEIMEITDYIQESAGQTAEVIWGYGTDPNLGEDLCVTVIATGFDSAGLNPTTGKTEPIKHVLDDNTTTVEANVPPVVPNTDQEPFIKTKETDDVVDQNRWDVSIPQKELFPSNDVADVPARESLDSMPENTLKLSEADNEVGDDAPTETTQEGFVIYNLDDMPEPADLTPSNTDTPATPEPPVTEEPFVAETPAAQPSATPSKEVFAERQRQITKNLAEFKTKLNLPGRIADLENEPAYKRRNISIDDTPLSSESQVSRLRLNEETDEHGERRIELRNDNPFLHDNVD